MSSRSSKGRAGRYPIRPANLAVYKTRRGRPPKEHSGVRVRTMVYLDEETLRWFAQKSVEITGKQKRRNDLIEGVLEDYKRSAIDGGIAICARHGEQGCYYCAHPEEQDR